MANKTPEIILATNNQHKAEEIAAILENQFIVRPMGDLGINEDIIEDGVTIEENANIKVDFLEEKLKDHPEPVIIMADDTGLFVDALEGAPGVYSARYAGEDCTFEDNNNKLLEALKDVPPEDRGAYFSTSLALITPDGKHHTVTSKIEGAISEDFLGTDGFGYDPVFIEKSTGKTYAQMSTDEKNQYSHRRAAIEEARDLLNNWIVIE